MNKKQLPAIVGILVIVALVVLTVMWLVNGMAAQAKSRNESDNDIVRLKGLNSARPYPSSENIGAEEANLTICKERRDALRKVVTGIEPRVPVSTSTGFQKEVERVTKRLRKLAGADRGEASKIKSDYAFGFKRYIDGFAEAEFIPRLLAQLELTAEISQLLFAAGIDSLEAVERDPFDAEKRGGGGWGDSDEDEDTDVRDGSFVSEDIISEGLVRERLTVEFRASQSVLLDVLNRIAKHPRFIKVNSLSFSKKQPDVRLPEIALNIDITNAEAESERLRTLPWKQRIVAGAEIENPLTVILELDIYWMESAVAREDSEDSEVVEEPSS